MLNLLIVTDPFSWEDPTKALGGSWERLVLVHVFSLASRPSIGNFLIAGSESVDVDNMLGVRRLRRHSCTSG